MATDPTTIPSVEDLQETKDYMEDINEFVNSENNSLVDSDGKTRRTLTGINNEFDAAQAGQFVVESTAQADRAEAEADRAEAAADNAFLNANVYVDIATGLLNTAVDEQFQVLSSDGSEYIRYEHQVGDIAVEVARYPSAEKVDDVEERFDGTFSQRPEDDGVILSVQDENEREILNATKDGTINPHKLNIPKETKIDNEDLQTFLLQNLSIDNENMFVFEDENGRVLFRISKDGTLYPAKLDPDISLTPLSQDSGNSFVMEDENGRVLFRVSNDGTFYVSKLDPDLIPVVENLDTYIPELIGGSLYVNNINNGFRYLIANSDNPSNPVVDNDNWLTYSTDSGSMSVELPDGEPVETFPLYEIAAFGDSLTAANWIGTVVGPALGVNTYNLATSGYGCADIAIRQGGLVPKLTLENNEVAASGVTFITDVQPATGYSPFTTTNITGSIGGVEGVLSKNVSTDVWTFTRNVDGSAVPVPSGVDFITNQGPLYDKMVQTLFMGRNNVLSSTFFEDVTRDMKGCVENLKNYNKRYVVISVTNAQYETIGTEGYNKIIELNDYLQETYGDYYFDLRSYMVNQAIYDAGITPTAQDLEAISNDAPPPSIMSDGVHPNSVGYNMMGNAVTEFLQSRGWF